MMSMLDSVPAIRRIDTDRSDVSAFEVFGHVSSADVENMFGLLEGAYALHDRIDVLVRLVEHDGVDWTDVSDETMKDGKSRAKAHVRKCAAVGEPNWISYATGFFSSDIGVELKHFSLEDEADAWAWLGAKPVDA